MSNYPISPKCGFITTIIGPMFSGKTEEFIRQINRKHIAGKKCLIIKNIIDNRYNINGDTHHITSHSGIRYNKSDIVYYSNIDDSDLKNIIEKYDIVGIDEGFFFKNISDICNKLANNGIDVIVSSIESSYKQELFEEIGKLIATSEVVIKMNAVCSRCGNDRGAFTVRTIDNDAQILVGGLDIYASICRNCLNKLKC